MKTIINSKIWYFTASISFLVGAYPFMGLLMSASMSAGPNGERHLLSVKIWGFTCIVSASLFILSVLMIIAARVSRARQQNRIIKSDMHEFQNLVIFQVKDSLRDKFGEALFSKENLASNLVVQKEGASSVMLELDVQKLILNLKGPNKVNIIKVSTSADLMGHDLRILYKSEYLKEITIGLLQEELARNKFVVEIIQKDDLRVLPGFIPQTMHYIEIQVSENFLEERSSHLSLEFQKTFNPDRYVDSNIAFFYIATILSGTADPL